MKSGGKPRTVRGFVTHKYFQQCDPSSHGEIFVFKSLDEAQRWNGGYPIYAIEVTPKEWVRCGRKTGWVDEKMEFYPDSDAPSGVLMISRAKTDIYLAANAVPKKITFLIRKAIFQ